MDEPVIDVQQLNVRARHGIVLSAVSFSAPPAHIVAVFGSPGAGKTALLQTVAGRSPLESGTIRVLGAAVTKRDPRVEYSPATASGATPHQWTARLASGGPPSQRAGRITRALEALDLYEIRDTPLRELSYGQRRAAALAAALASSAPVLLVDGLLDGLADPLLERALDCLRGRVERESCTVIVATGRSEIAERADIVLFLDAGRALAYEPPEAILARCAAETVSIEAEDPALLQNTLRGVFDLEMEEMPGGVSFRPADGALAAAEIFRHPPRGTRTVYVRRPTLWDSLKRLREGL